MLHRRQGGWRAPGAARQAGAGGHPCAAGGDQQCERVGHAGAAERGNAAQRHLARAGGGDAAHRQLHAPPPGCAPVSPPRRVRHVPLSLDVSAWGHGELAGSCACAGIDAEGLPPDLDCHHLVVNSWDDLEAPQNVCIASIPTVFDPSLAPDGKALIHAYTAGNEPWEAWAGLDRRSEEYGRLKVGFACGSACRACSARLPADACCDAHAQVERSEVLWRALERAIPDVRDRAELVQVGTPLTHARFLNRHAGTYGPAISAAGGSFPGPQTPIPGLYRLDAAASMGPCDAAFKPVPGATDAAALAHRCGDSCAPGIGVPAAAASGMITANTLAPVQKHLQLLDSLVL